MRAFFSATKMLFSQMWSDKMLAVLTAAPLMMGVAFHFGVPRLEEYLCARLSAAAILSPYYAVFDLLLALMTPIMFTAAGALVVLDEADAGLVRAIAVTPVGRGGYLASRIGCPALVATVYCVAALSAFHLSALHFESICLLSLCAGVLGLAVCLLIVAFAKNKVEGMALSKLSGLFCLGVPAALLVPAPARYIAAILPTYWMTELAFQKSLWNTLPALVTGAAWFLLFSRRFMKKTLS